jgi:hypothetical protein
VYWLSYDRECLKKNSSLIPEKGPHVFITTVVWKLMLIINGFFTSINKLDELNIQTDVVVIDKTSYRFAIVDKELASNTMKAEMLLWLSLKNVTCDPNHIRAELLNLVRKTKTKILLMVQLIGSLLRP